MNTFHNIMGILKEVTDFWPVKWVLVILLFLWAKTVIGLEIKEIFTTIMREFTQLFSLDPTPGALNALAIIVTALIGVLIMAALGFSEFRAFADSIAPTGAASDLHEAASPIWLAVAVGCIALGSVWAAS